MTTETLPTYPWFDQAPPNLKTRAQLAKQGLKPGGDYVWFVKENQPDLLASLKLLFERPRLAKGWSDPTTDFRTV